MEVRAAIAATGLADERVISLTFDGNVLVSLNYELNETEGFVFDNLGQPSIDVSDIEIAIAKRVNDTGEKTGSDNARDTATREINEMACAAADRITTFRANYVAKRRAVASKLNQTTYAPNITRRFEWGRLEDGGLFWYRFALLTFQLPHCHC